MLRVVIDVFFRLALIGSTVMFFVFSSLVCRLTISFSISLLRERTTTKNKRKKKTRKPVSCLKNFYIKAYN